MVKSPRRRERERNKRSLLQKHTEKGFSGNNVLGFDSSSCSFSLPVSNLWSYTGILSFLSYFLPLSRFLFSGTTMKSRDCPFFAAVYCKCHLFRDAANRPLTPQRLLSASCAAFLSLFSSIVTGFSSFLLSVSVKRVASGDTLLSFPLLSRKSPKTSLSFSPHSPSLPSALKKRSIPDYRPRDLDRGRRTDEDGGESSREEMGGGRERRCCLD